jgi:demethylmenaquinone methyltransferase / 2-methoxy-6-polyprenyl-1,4-benzoquinol methylase
MPRLRDLDLARHLADPALKQQFVTPMFDLVAPRYDAFTRVFSFGMDRHWKGAVVQELGEHAAPGARILDLACGTGDLAIAATAAIPLARVVGVDASSRMLDLARSRLAEPATPTFLRGDMGHLDFADGSIDAITAGYAFRNAPDHRAALREAARVLRPGGAMVTLDFYRPAGALWRGLFLAYLRTAGSAVGWWWHREPLAYGYIAPSIDAFVGCDNFSSDLIEAGFGVRRVRKYLWGGVAIHVGVRCGM